MTKLSHEDLGTFLADHAPWKIEQNALVREYAFDDFAAALAFVVEVGAVAQAKDHHPDVTLGWGRAKLVWTTHDAGGVTALDLALAEESDRRYRT